MQIQTDSNTNIVESSATTATSSNSVDKSSEVFGSYLEDDTLTTAQKREYNIKELTEGYFGDTSFSKALQDEFSKQIDENMSTQEFMDLTATLTTLNFNLNGFTEKIMSAIERGDNPKSNLGSNSSSTNYINEFQDFLFLLKEDDITEDKELKKSYQNILKDVLEKTIEYEKQKDVALNQHLQSSQTINSFQVGA